ncbi:potassium channel family protein [Acetivibrio cellulolyticus]|uniref:potassium channel family protein n=1 Tax=Acetivibrio cellulolyticus TaxID=35830 RepID=UPI00058BF8A2|nr:ion transporter [Acetivibrio cellulolyticus]
MKDFAKNKKLIILYEIFIAVLALVAVVMAIMDFTGIISIESSTEFYLIDTSILIIFAVDYFVRLGISKNKKAFFKENIIDLIAIIPFSSIFRIFRMFRLFRIVQFVRFVKILKVFRILSFVKRFSSKSKKFVYTNGFVYVIYFTLITIILGAIGIYFAEKNNTINSFQDAIWWSFVTASTVGYGDISPKTTLGRIIAVILMLVGIGFIGMLTGTIATYFVKKVDNSNKTKDEIKEEDMIGLSDLNTDEINEVMKYIEFLKSKRNND